MNKTNLLIDLGILSAFLVATQPHLTGTSIHEWLSLALTATLIIHLLLHWDWIVNVGAQYFKKLLHVSRLKFFIDLLLLVSMTTLILSGILISRTLPELLGFQLNAARSWKQIHSLSSDISLLLVALHFALNWNWVAGMSNKYLISPIRRLFTKKSDADNALPLKINQ
ncbi:MAG: DUF4405 domain-containing protein [Anaerolineae bacterium]|nr:DUF4405 domain-containing protein [Anaerolineae bacterium]